MESPRNPKHKEKTMRIAKEDIPIKVNTPGAVARQKTDFGDAAPYNMIGAEYFSLAAGVDMAPLLAGLEHDMCHSPHWGYVIEGDLNVTYKDGSEEQVSTGDMFYWPPYHSIKVTEDSEFVLFSPQHEHTPVMDHVNQKLGDS